MIFNVYILFAFALNFMKFCSCPGEEDLEKTRADLQRQADESYKMDDCEKTISICTQLIMLCPEASCLKLRALCYLKKDDRESALNDFDKVVEEDESLPASKKKGYGRALLSLAMLELEKTEEAYKEIQFLPSDHILMMGDELLGKENYEKSLIYYNQAIKLFPRDGECYRRRGIYHWKRDNFGNAIRDFETAIGLEPYPRAIEFDFVKLLLDAKQLEEAKTTLKKIELKYKYNLGGEKEKIEDFHSRIQQMEEI